MRVTELVRTILPVSSVLDVGCAYGTWLKAWGEGGAADLVGIDGPWVDVNHLQIPATSFVSRNLEESIDLQRRFDLVQSLEVAEHLPAACAATFIASLVAHSDAVLFSAAPPGQGGEGHVNEQPYEYWRRLFANRGFVAIDCLRPLLAQDPSISPWYRYNTLLYIRAAQPPQISAFAAMFTLRDGQPIRDVAPSVYRLRRARPCANRQGQSSRRFFDLHAAVGQKR